MASIDDAVEAAVIGTLVSSLSLVGGARLSSEIQDNGEFLLVCVDLVDAAESWPPAARQEFLKAASIELHEKLPQREGDYRWMIVIRVGGIVIDSVMGGWSGRPAV
jgi:hypothetical protein